MELVVILLILFLLSFCYLIENKAIKITTYIVVLALGFLTCDIISFILVLVYFGIMLSCSKKLSLLTEDKKLNTKNITINIVIISVVVLLANAILLNQFSLHLMDFIEKISFVTSDIKSAIPLELSILPKIILSVLILHKPSNTLIKLVLNKLSNNENNEDNTENNKLPSGELIGTIERFLMIFFLLLGQSTLLGLVLIVKSIIKREELKNKSYAERFLVGTLLSLLIAIITYYTLYKIISNQS